MAIITKILGIPDEDVTGDCSFADDLGADSIDIMELVLALEDEFSCEISDEEAERLITVQQVIDHLVERGD